MGGKSKPTQNRTKNNSRPSNSSRSAELFGGNLPAFVGFTSLSHCGNDVPVLPGFQTPSASTADATILDEIDANVDSKYQLVLRKMTKKDSTTKVKALQEFCELVNGSDVDEVVAILPFWPRLYANLSTDVEHRVREASQQSQAAVSVKCGKAIAPFLRQLAPAWITSQYDSYAPAASIASQSFQKAFRPFKQQEVFTYCQNEILDFITRNLTVSTPASMSTASRTLTPEECEAKYSRIVSCSLKGYTQYLSKMTPEQLIEAAAKNALIVENPKFWTFHKYKSVHIRSAWFEALSAILQYAPSFVEGHRQQTTSAALQSLDESEPGVLPHVWSAILLVTQKIDDWTKHINMEKALLPKLWKVLKSGGSGSAAVIYPHLLPLLAKLNGDALGAKLQLFYTDFFQNFNLGLRARSGQQSRSDMSAIASAYYECLQYVLIQIQKNEVLPADSDELFAYAKQLVQVHVVDVIGWCLHEDVHGTKSIFASIAALINYWSQNSSASTMNANIVEHFWNEIYRVLENSLVSDDRTDKVLDLQFELVQSLRSGQTFHPKSAKVKFTTAEDQENEAKQSKPVVKVCVFNELALRLCSMYMKKATEKLSPHYINNLETLLETFGNEEFYKRLSGDNIFKLYDKMSVWLLIQQLRQENVVDIILRLYPMLNAEEKEKLLNQLIKFPNEEVQSWVIVRLLSYPLCVEPNISKLLALPNVKQALLKCANRVVEGESKDNINFLHKCFFQNENGDILIDDATCTQIVEIVAAALTDDTRVGVLDNCASFLAQIMPVICCDEKKASLKNYLFIKFFEFSVNKEVSDDLTQDTLWEITTSWQDALSSNDLTLCDKLLEVCADIVNAKLAETETTSIECIDNMSEIVAKLILCSIERIEDEAVKYQRADQILNAIFDQRSKSYHSKMSYIEHVSLFLESIKGQMTVPDLGSRLGTTEDLRSVATIDSFFKLSAFRFNVIFKITCSVKKTRPEFGVEVDPEAGDDEYTEDFCDIDENLVKSYSDIVFKEILNGIYVGSLANSLLDSCYKWNEFTELCMIYLTEQIPLYLQNVSIPNQQTIREKLFAAATTKGLFWTKSVLFLTSIEPYSDPENGLTVLREDDPLCNTRQVHYVNLLQSFASKTGPRLLPIDQNIFIEDVNADLLKKTTTIRCLIQNYANSDLNNQDDRKIMESSVAFMNSLSLECKRDKPFFLYNEDITSISSERIIMISEIANFYAAVIRAYPHRLETNEWDLIRIAVSSWVLTVSKSSDSFQSPKVAVFILAIYKLFHAFYSFILPEEKKSSTHMLSTMIEEWNHLFAKDVNLILLKCFLKFVSKESNQITDQYFVDMLSQYIDIIDFRHVTAAKRIDSKTSLDDVIQFSLQNISHPNHNVRIACATILKSLASGLIATDLETMQKENESIEAPKGTASWHLLHKFRSTMERHNALMDAYRSEFNFKTNDLDELSDVPHEVAIPLLLLWDCVVDVCAKSASEIRSIYASFLTETQFVQTMLVTLFRLMPVEILRNQDAKHIGQAYFVPLTDGQIAVSDIAPKRLACHLYIRTLRHLPAAARKWWHDSVPVQKTLVDKITTNFVSGQLCQEELRGLIDKKEKHENMQLTVHTFTREVLATYILDEARMELIVTLPSNHPLGAVKVDIGKQIGGRMQGRVLVMQLTIFLTHQNGSISDGLSLWKHNLDRKFEGVQECYVCYSVIHQDTCQLPKLTCRKCKNKFHGPCLYKWFSTSNKSTCPICRSVF